MCTDRIEQVEKKETLEEFFAAQPIVVDRCCCETCRYFVHYSRYCALATRPLIDFGFKLGDGDPAEFWCNHWQQKEEQK